MVVKNGAPCCDFESIINLLVSLHGGTRNPTHLEFSVVRYRVAAVPQRGEGQGQEHKKTCQKQEDSREKSKNSVGLSSPPLTRTHTELLCYVSEYQKGIGNSEARISQPGKAQRNAPTWIKGIEPIYRLS